MAHPRHAGVPLLLRHLHGRADRLGGLERGGVDVGLAGIQEPKARLTSFRLMASVTSGNDGGRMGARSGVATMSAANRS